MEFVSLRFLVTYMKQLQPEMQCKFLESRAFTSFAHYKQGASYCFHLLNFRYEHAEFIEREMEQMTEQIKREKLKQVMVWVWPHWMWWFGSLTINSVH
ncbi:unnamed protein product [Lactuca virosa]|uniref:Uncharacterized protein n=1 Tax=Lactuca virosa TaxID=75947 RepID=A0AAU9PBP7_9ASTR|nr:unnamed protein product [Lactuca virosa]